MLRREGLTRSKAENVNNVHGRPDLLVSLDQLEAQLPAVKSVTLVVSWFGDDLRAGVCQIRPGVEIGEKHTLPFAWRAGGVDRSGARVLAGDDGRPVYGGTPADRTVVQIIAELKRRGYAVTLYPFLMMDVRPGNGKADPYGAGEQAAFPWRGRIACHPAPGRAGSPDGSGAAAAQVNAFFGQASASQFAIVDGEVRFGGSEWSWSRAVLHYARLAELAGGVDAFLIGSELRGLTAVRDGVNSYPGVRALRRLAGECRKVLRAETALSYAADWSEWFGHQPADPGSSPGQAGHVSFNLDPLWSDPAISFVGVDWYPPGADWRDGVDHLDAQAGYAGLHDPEYLRANVAGAEGFDWFYASAEDRAAQLRTPITDGAHGEPWVFRPKDVSSWWGSAHHDRPGGVRSATPTGWVPRSKPIRLVEFGSPAVDKGANSPNLFYDPKSSESGLPPFSDGSRDDLGQRRAVEALLRHFADEADNPVSPVYGGPMVASASAWCWDARPFPDFPGRPRVWADAPNWTYGHWLNGRAGVAPAAELLAAVLARGGVGPDEVDLTEAVGSVTGYVVDRPMSLRDAVAPLLEVFGLDAADRDGRLGVVARDGPALTGLGDDELAWPDEAAAPERHGRRLAEPATGARARFVDDATEYSVAVAVVSAESAGRGGILHLDLPVVAGRGLAERVARRRLRRDTAEVDDAVVHLSPETALRLEPGDRLRLGESSRVWRVVQVDADETPTAKLVAAEAPDGHQREGVPEWRPGESADFAGPPTLHLLDLPPLIGAPVEVEADARPLAAVAGEPWRRVDVLAGASTTALTLRARASDPAGVGETVSELRAGPRHRLGRGGGLVVRVEGASLQSRSPMEISSGANALAVVQPDGEWEVLQFLDAELVAPETYRLGRLLRGQSGTNVLHGVPAGAAVVVLDADLVRVEVSTAERGTPLIWRAAPVGAIHDVSTTETVFTWRGLHARPWDPAHLKARRTPDGGVRLSWTRRARIAGDSWEGEPPPNEDREIYRVEVSAGAGTGSVRTWDVAAQEVIYTPEQLAADFPAGLPDILLLEVRQGSATFGWGVPSRRELLL